MTRNNAAALVRRVVGVEVGPDLWAERLGLLGAGSGALGTFRVWRLLVVAALVKRGMTYQAVGRSFSNVESLRSRVERGDGGDLWLLLVSPDGVDAVEPGLAADALAAAAARGFASLLPGGEFARIARVSCAPR